MASAAEKIIKYLKIPEWIQDAAKKLFTSKKFGDIKYGDARDTKPADAAKEFGLENVADKKIVEQIFSLIFSKNNQEKIDDTLRTHFAGRDAKDVWLAELMGKMVG